jgi:hypothetical protein
LPINDTAASEDATLICQSKKDNHQFHMSVQYNDFDFTSGYRSLTVKCINWKSDNGSRAKSRMQDAFVD